LGLGDQLIRASEKSEKRFIYRNQKLWEISPRPLKFLLSGLLSVPGRLRVPLEYFISASRNPIEESIYDFALRRIGKEAADVLISPMVTGIFGGDAKKLSLAACFPAMAEMERDYGGLIKAMIQKKKKNKASARRKTAGPSGHLTSFKGGLYTLIEALEKNLFPYLRRGVTVETINRNRDNTYVLETDRASVVCDEVVLAVPAFAAARMLQKLQPETAEHLRAIEYAGIAVVCQGFRKNEISHPVDGFGFLVPPDQGCKILGSIWTSVLFPDQAPPDEVLFRTMLGGAYHPELTQLSESQLAAIAVEELSRIIGISGKPTFEEIVIWKNAIPQYTLGHLERLGRIESNLRSLQNVHLAGNAYSGVSLNDVIKRAYRIAGQFNRIN
jgi:oxygen-dependent protoporphyrinogen oxidase